MSKHWKYDLIIHEGSDEFWEGQNPETGERRGYATSEEVTELIKKALWDYGFQSEDDFELRLRQYNDD